MAAPPLARLLDPAPFDPSAILHPVQRGVERRERKPQRASGSLLDQPGDFISVVAVLFEDRQNQNFGAAFLGFFDRRTRGHAALLYEGELYIRTNAGMRNSECGIRRLANPKLETGKLIPDHGSRCESRLTAE